jgi:hypothetical protein
LSVPAKPLFVFTRLCPLDIRALIGGKVLYEEMLAKMPPSMNPKPAPSDWNLDTAFEATSLGRVGPGRSCSSKPCHPTLVEPSFIESDGIL